MTKRNLVKNDIIEVSYLHLPVAKKLPKELAQFTCRVRDVRDADPGAIIPAQRIIHIDGGKDWLEVWWEQRSANRFGALIVPPEGVNITKLPKIRFLKRPR